MLLLGPWLFEDLKIYFDFDCSVEAPLYHRHRQLACSSPHDFVGYGRRREKGVCVCVAEAEREKEKYRGIKKTSKALKNKREKKGDGPEKKRRR